MNTTKLRIAIFASGGGSNAEAIMQHFSEHESVEVVLVLSNKKDAGVLGRAARHKIPSQVLSKEIYSSSDALMQLMTDHNIDLIALAGYLKLIPAEFTRALQKRIVNIHPGLLPRYGGKGMHGIHVHEAVLRDQAAWSGVTVHFVDDQYDRGSIIFQHAIPIDTNWSPKELATAVLKVEHTWFPVILDRVCEEVMGESNS